MSVLAPAIREVMYPVLRKVDDFPIMFAANDPIMELFANGEEGGVWDIQDLSALFQDANGLIPAVVGQPVGLLLDKSKSFAKGADLTVNGTFTTGTGWSFVASSVSSGHLQLVAAANNSGAYQTVAGYAGGLYEITVVVTSISQGAITATLGVPVPNGTNALNITQPGTYTFKQANLAGDAYLRVYSVGASTTASINSVSVKRLAGNHAFQNTTASKPILRQDADGYYLQYDGFDDRLSTVTINFTITDKITVAAAVTKVSSTRGIIAFLGNTTYADIGCFDVEAGSSGPADYGLFINRSTLAQCYTTAVYPVPITNILLCAFDYAGATNATQMDIRINGAAAPIGSRINAATAGNFGSFPLHFGRFGNGTSPFGGHMRRKLVISRLLTLEEKQRVEEWGAEPTGVVLP